MLRYSLLRCVILYTILTVLYFFKILHSLSFARIRSIHLSSQGNQGEKDGYTDHQSRPRIAYTTFRACNMENGAQMRGYVRDNEIRMLASTLLPVVLETIAAPKTARVRSVSLPMCVNAENMFMFTLCNDTGALDICTGSALKDGYLLCTMSSFRK